MAGTRSTRRDCIEVEFRGEAGTRLLTLTHSPLRPSGAGVVICSPLGAEQVENHRRELELATHLARRGVFALRYHARGCGDSDGETEALSFDSLRMDAVRSARGLLGESGVDRIAFVGTRLAAMVAAAAARDFGAAPVAMWEPVVDSGAYFEEIFRYELIKELMQSKQLGQATRRSLQGDLEAAGVADVLGFPVARQLFDTSRARRLEDDLAATARPTLLLQVRRQRGLSNEYSTLVGALSERGATVETLQFEGSIPWWFSVDAGRADSEDEAMIAATLEWLTDALGVQR